MKSSFISTLNVHLIKLLKLKATPKLGMKLYLKQLFSGKVLKTYGLITLNSVNYKFLCGENKEVVEI